MNRKIRLGPVAIFLTVVAIVLTTLAVLTQATSRADLVMAGRFAEVTEERYAIEEDGQRFLMEIDDKLSDGTFDAEEAGFERTEDGTLACTISRGGYDLRLVITEPDRSGNYKIKKWKIARQWNAPDPFGNVWQGPSA